MGQYFMAVILTDDKKEIKAYAEPHDFKYEFNGKTFSCYSKLTEHSYVGNDFVANVEKKLVNKPQRLVWAGDYADKQECGKNLYDLCELEGHKKIRQNKKADLEMLEGMRVINHDKKQYFIMSTRKSDECVFDPLPILTCDNNGNGGGDYYGDWNKELVGTWSGDMIEIRTKAPKGYNRIYPEFMESWMNGYYEREEENQNNERE